MTTRKALCNIKGISEAKVEKIKEAALKVSGVRKKTQQNTVSTSCISTLPFSNNVIHVHVVPGWWLSHSVRICR